MEEFGIFNILTTAFGFLFVALIAGVIGILVRSIADDEKDWRR